MHSICAPDRIQGMKKSLLRRFAAYYKPHIWRFVLDMVCAFGTAAVDLAFPLITQYALTTLLPAQEYTGFFYLLGLAFVLYLLRAYLTYVVTYLGHDLGVRMEADMRRDVFCHMQSLPFRFYDKERTGKLLSRVTTDLFDITELAHHGPEDVFISVVTIIGAFIAMFIMEWRLALVLLVTLFGLLYFVFRMRQHMRQRSGQVKQRTAEINADIESAISGVRVAKAFANEAYEIEKFQRGNDRFVHSKSDYYRTMAIFHTGMDFFIALFNVLVLFVGGLLIMKGEFDTVVLVTFTLFVSTFVSPVRRLSNFMEVLTMGRAGFVRFCEILDVEPDVKDAPNAQPLKNVHGKIEFDNVSFSYDEGRTVLSHISFTVAAGETLALVGPSGGGKTTLCHLIPRFYDTTAGTIKIDGQDIRQLTLASLRSNIGIVQQDVFLFAGTVRDNIRYGRTDATDDEIVWAAKLAEIHEDIMRLPDGYDTQVGERGVTLSGGQKQRVSIARIFLKDPPILLLDEATSALDTATEAKIQAAFDRLSEGRTALVIAHRLSTVRNADEIIVIDEQGIRERGTHEQLMASGGVYAQLNDIQV